MVYLYHAIDKHGDTPDACEFPGRVLKPNTAEKQPEILNTGKHASYSYAIARLVKEGKLCADIKQW